MTIQAYVSQPVPTGMVGQFIAGLGYPLRGLKFMREHSLWGLASASIVVNALLLIGVLVLAFSWIVPWVQGSVAAMVAWAGASAFWGFLVGVLNWLIWVLVLPATVVLSFVVLVLVGQAVASPFLDTLSEEVESRVLGTPTTPMTAKRMVQDVTVALVDLAGGLILLCCVNLPILVIGLIPGIGTLVGPLLSFMFTALLLAHEFVGLSMARHLVSYRGRWRAVWANRWSALGLGTSAMGLLFVPVVNLVLLPLAAVGGTLLYCDLRAAGRISV